MGGMIDACKAMHCTRCNGLQRMTMHSVPCTHCGGSGYEPRSDKEREAIALRQRFEPR